MLIMVSASVSSAPGAEKNMCETLVKSSLMISQVVQAKNGNGCVHCTFCIVIFFSSQ